MSYICIKKNSSHFPCDTYIYVNKSDIWNADFGGLEISICHQIVNTLELSASPPLKKKKKKNLVKFQTTNTCSIQKKWSHCETVALWTSLVTRKLAQYRSLWCHWKPDCQVCHLFCGCLVDTVRLPCAFAPIFRIQSHFQYCYQSIQKIHIITET